MRTLVLALLSSTLLCGGNVTVAFDPTNPVVGPFPTNFLTTPDETQKTGRRVNLPLPDCEAKPGDCQEITLINELDGFNVQARIMVVFNGPVSPDTLRGGVRLLWLDGSNHVTAVNRVSWDPATNTMLAKPDEPLRQGLRYAVLVTDAVKDVDGEAVKRDEGFQACIDERIGGAYCTEIKDTVALAGQVLPDAVIAGGSVFTTMTGTSLLEAARQMIDLSAPAYERVASVLTRDIKSLTVHAQVRTEGEKFDEVPFPAPPAILALLGINRIAFGTLASPRLLNDQQIIPTTPTLDPLPKEIGFDKLAFHVLLPSTPMPDGGYPVLLAAHGLGDNRLAGPSVLAQSFMPKGYAIVALNAVGHGYGPESTLRVGTDAGVQEFPAPGRGMDLDGDGVIGTTEGCVVLVPGAPISIRDCVRQTAIDWMAMARAIKLGLDLDGDGRPDLDGSRMSFWGQSLGAFTGTLVMATDPDISSAVLNVGGASGTETARVSLALRPLVQAYLGRREPALLNALPDFDEQYVGRDEPAKILSVAGAADLKDEFERLEWIEASGAPSTYAPHLKTAPLDGVPAKRVLFQFAIGDQTVPNPSNSLLVRCAGGQALTSIYRHDLARALRPGLPADPHAYFAFLLDVNGAPISLAVLAQAVTFVQSGEDVVPDANYLVTPFFGVELFETPLVLPETTGFLP
ncbi:Ig-like domain-containing protein [uncultured Paludibaculum sp.]|uniref:Ig-like domain-containing protein n=1 Tax=uncultured Paludibaculum sp. TaxID=1765020 RepID=UPI002AAA713E|nr:Ig-like domain-containing protein [uncultured Paludibaculum sp.]